jgi:PAS domain S-box-containing protein
LEPVSEIDDDLGLHGEACLYRTIFETAIEAIVVIDDDGVIRACNPAAARLFGYRGDEMQGGNVRDIMAPPYRDVRSPTGERETGVRRILGSGRAVAGVRKNGSTFTLELSITEWRQNGERLFTGILRDVTEDVRVRELQRLMVNELNHRVKNTLATVQAIDLQTLRNSETPRAAALALNKRLVALAGAHDILTRESWEGAAVTDIVAAAVEAHGAGGATTCSGPSAWLAPKPAVALALILHELFTNAGKFGALAGGGQVSISWAGGTAGQDLILTWREQGGPAVTAPVEHGFGLRMMEALASDLSGEVRLDFRTDGLVCVIRTVVGAPL